MKNCFIFIVILAGPSVSPRIQHCLLKPVYWKAQNLNEPDFGVVCDELSYFSDWEVDNVDVEKQKCVFISVSSPVCDGLWLSHCCRRLNKRGVDKVSRPKVHGPAGGRYTAGQPTVPLRPRWS